MSNILETLLDYEKKYRSLIWLTTDPDKLIYPELDIYNQDHGIGISFSGGGSRACSMGIGAMRFLAIQEPKYFKTCQFLSSVSGGSWFSGVFLMATSYNPEITFEKILGKSIAPQDMTIENLNTENFDEKYYMGNVLDKQFIIRYLIEYIQQNYPLDLAWPSVIGRIFLEPYGLLNKIICLNQENKDLILKLNPYLQEEIIFPKSEYPFWICNTTLLKNNVTEKIGATSIAMTPLYAGFPQIINNGELGGYLIQTFCYGSEAPGKDLNTKQNFTNVNVKKRGNTITLQDMIGCSSAAYAFDFLEITKKLLIPLSVVVPKFDIWSVKNPETTKKTFIGDGGICDDLGIVSLVARGVKKILSFNSIGLDSSNNFCSTSLLPLFGVYSIEKCGNSDGFPPPPQNSIQIFKSTDWQAFRQLLLDSNKTGGPTFARMKLEVLPNIQNGVKGNYIVDLMVITTNPSSQFINLLSTSVQEELKRRSKNGLDFRTILQERYRLSQLSRFEINLYTSFTDWCIQYPTVRAQLEDLYLSPIGTVN